jgi:hypothetical protein
MKNILTSPRFWAALLAIVFVLLGTYAPVIAAHVDQTAITTAVIALVAFIAAASIEPGGSYVGLFRSIKFWSLVVSLVFIFVRAFVPGFPINETLIQDLILTLGITSVGVTYRAIGEVKT